MTDLTSIDELRKSGRDTDAKDRLVELAAAYPNEAAVQYAAACVHDFLELERAAIPYYLAAIQNGLSGDDLRGAYLGLGSTYRALGNYEDARQTLTQGLQQFPEAREMRVFLAMTQYNLAEYHQATASLLLILAETTADPQIKQYARAIQLYAEDLGRTWD